MQVLCDELQVELLVAGGILACRLLALRRHNLVEGAEACVDVLRNRRILPSSPLQHQFGHPMLSSSTGPLAPFTQASHRACR